MSEFHFSDLKLTTGNDACRQDLIISTTEDAMHGKILVSIEITQVNHLITGYQSDVDKEESICIEYLDEKQAIELYHYLKSCLLSKYPSI